MPTKESLKLVIERKKLSIERNYQRLYKTEDPIEQDKILDIIHLQQEWLNEFDNPGCN